MTYVPFTIKMTTEEIVSKLKASFGSEFTATEIKAFCAMNDIAYATVTKRLKNFKTAKGKWNLEVTTAAVENIEKSFSSPAVQPDTERNLVPEKDNTFVKFGSFPDIKKLLLLNYSIHALSQDYQVMVRPLVSSKHVLSWVEKLFV